MLLALVEGVVMRDSRQDDDVRPVLVIHHFTSLLRSQLYIFVSAGDQPTRDNWYWCCCCRCNWWTWKRCYRHV